MASITFKDGNEYALRLSKLAGGSRQIAGKAIYAAAGICADKIKENIRALPAVDDKHNLIAYKNGEKSKLSIAQKRGLIESLGIAEMEDRAGYLNVKIGFDGYNEVRTGKYPTGQPNQLIARVVESGSSYTDAMPFFGPAVNVVRGKMIKEMQRIIDEEIEKIME